MTRLSGLPLAIGSLPHKDAEEAVDLIFKYLPATPFWPQLPKLNKREGMVRQFLEKFPIPYYSEGETGLEEFYEKITNRDIEYFKISKDYAAGLYAFKDRLKNNPGLLKNIKFIKCQITGPFTAAASTKNENGDIYLNDPVFLQVFKEGLKMKALWQLDFFKEFNKPVILFIDEPYLSAFGSAFTPVNRDDVIRGLGELAAGIKSDTALIGLHCCGNTDWSIFTDIPGINIINFDAFEFRDRFVLYADSLAHFLKRGGFICWGIVPTEGYSESITPDSLFERIENGVEALSKKGLNRELLYNQMFLSPACGLGSLDIGKSEKILKTLSETAEILRKKPPK
ncbi:MAG: hypothetical protein ABSE81_05985 [Candidatus Omnitrophota bacterium]|jgi:methionine synthase II (cobalamin-independent)